MKKLLTFVSISSLLLIGSFIVIHLNYYSINQSEKEIQGVLLAWYQENDIAENQLPLLLEILTIDSSNTVVATFLHREEEIGAIVFKKGLFEKLKLENVLYGKAFYSEFIDTNKGFYALFVGENPHLGIKTIHTDMVEEKNRMDIHVPPQKYFTHYEKVENISKSRTSSVFYYRTLRGAIDAASKEYQGMELMFVDEENKTFMLHSLIDETLLTVIGAYEQIDDGFTLISVKTPISYSMEGDKSFCFVEKNIDNANKELTYLHGLIPNVDDVVKVVLEVEVEDKVVYKNSSEVINQQFFLHIQIPEQLNDNGDVVKKFHLYNKNGEYIGTEFKL